jgi:hypothetical protein
VIAGDELELMSVELITADGGRAQGETLNV